MIANEKIKIYLRYKGDIDGFTIVDTPDEKAVIAENEFYEIRDLTQDIILMKRNLVSKEYAKRVMNKIRFFGICRGTPHIWGRFSAKSAIPIPHAEKSRQLLENLRLKKMKEINQEMVD